MKNEDYLQPFVDYLTEEDKSPGTISGYEGDVKSFLKFLKKKAIKDIKTSDIQLYKEMLQTLDLSSFTINRKLVGIKQFIDFLNEHFGLAIVVRIKQEKIDEAYSLNDDELLSQTDYERLMMAVEDAGDIRTKAMFEAMYYSGMRVSEMLQMRRDHVENELRVIKDIKGKGSRKRPIYISNKLLDTLKEYLKVRKQPFSSTTNALFVGERGPVTRQTPHILMKKYAGIAGIELSKAHVHNFRHLFALRLVELGWPIQDIANYLGHKSIEVTKIYLTRPQSEYIEGINRL
ncbi:tyrosine-type recombinase/integrase [Mesobacillus zeae]|uniref:tyrosine-type recombinase/integrase n=1 Tax=Mesobacillus zeae TaxID=1917180 RepID=UPI003008B7C2